MKRSFMSYTFMRIRINLMAAFQKAFRSKNKHICDCSCFDGCKNRAQMQHQWVHLSERNHTRNYQNLIGRYVGFKLKTIDFDLWIFAPYKLMDFNFILIKIRKKNV
nr:uncharacterized protein LOC122270466 [Parasteatoda tepidariorum]